MITEHYLLKQVVRRWFQDLQVNNLSKQALLDHSVQVTKALNATNNITKSSVLIIEHRTSRFKRPFRRVTCKSMEASDLIDVLP